MFYPPRINFVFVWQGINTAGQRINGSENAPNKKAVIEILKQQQIIPLTIQRNLLRARSQKKFKPSQLIYFSQQLAQLTMAGLSISHSLHIIANNFQTQKQWLLTIKQQIDNGATLSSTLAQYPQDFNAVYCALIRSGEKTGKLAEILLELVNYLETTYCFKQKIRKALHYPTIVTILATLVTIGLLTFVIPQFQQTFSSFGVTLPALTKLIINAANFFHRYYLFLGGSLFILFFLFRFLLNNNLIFRYQFHRLILHLPIIRHILIRTTSTIWIKILSTTITAGLPLIDGLHLANHILTNLALRKMLTPLTTAIEQGVSLHAAMQSCQIFSDTTLQLILVGENTGRLDLMLQKLAAIHQQQMSHFFDVFTQLLEPLIMLILALFATLLIVAMYLPIFRMGALL